jgi:predicted RNA-binding protein with PIN domain
VKKLMLIDGYNLIHASPKLTELAADDLEASRDELVRVMVDYAAREDVRVEVVFDAGGRPGAESREKISDLVTVTYTAQGKTADARLEQAAYESTSEQTTVVTGDYHQQKVAGGAGALRVSSREFVEELESRQTGGTGKGRPGAPKKRSRLEDRLPEDVLERLREMREKR